MIDVMRCAGVVLVLVGACSKRETPSSEPVAAGSSRDATAEASADDAGGNADRAATPGRAGNTVNIDDWKLILVLPEGATHTYEADAARVTIGIARDEQAVIRKVDAPAPPGLEAAAARWSAGGGKEPRTLTEGVSDGGVLYRAETFRVRVGHSDPATGSVVHTWKDVTRVHGILALDGATHVECTVYIEYGYEITADDPAVRRGLSLCQSMATR